MAEQKVTSLTWALYGIKPRNPFRWLKRTAQDTHTLVKRIWFAIRHGYYPQARWETFEYLIEMFDELLLWYRNDRTGTPFINGEDSLADGWEDRISETYDKYLDEMLELLNRMKEDVDTLEEQNARQEYTNKFFEMFGNIFYNLWD